MKNRSYIFLFAITIMAVIGWWNHQKLSDLRESRDRLSARAEKLGISEYTNYINKRLRPDRTAAAQLAAAHFIKHHKQRETIRLAGGDPETSPETAATASREWMAALDSKQIRLVIGEILSDPELDDQSRRKLIGQSLGFLAKKNPAGALSLFVEFSSHLKDTGLGRQVASKSLGALAEDDPHAAFAWARNQRSEFPGIIQSAKGELISKAGVQDPALAFEMIRELGPDYRPGSAESSILRSTRPEMRTFAFVAFRQHLTTMDDANMRRGVEREAYKGLAEGIAEEGFEAGSKWLASAEPSPDEMIKILDDMGIGLANSRRHDDAGPWMEWIAETLPAGKREEPIIDMMKYWTDSDYGAAGKWLASATGSPARNAAIRSYAQTVFQHDPETAMQWIMILPPGAERQHTLRFILVNKLRDDPEAAAAFAKEHGIGK
jgi:hypothetical protein